MEETPDVRSDIQEVVDEAGEESNVQDGIEISEDAPLEREDDCEYTKLNLIPLITGVYPGPMNCEEFGNGGNNVVEFRILVFQGEAIMLDEILPCIDNEVVIELLPPGDYEVAAEAPPLFSGLMKLTLIHPDLPVICSPPACCPPVTVSASPCETITASMVFCCEDYACYDCCAY